MNWKLIFFFLACLIMLPFLGLNIIIDLRAGSLFAALLNLIGFFLVLYVITGLWDGTIDPRD